MKDKIKQMLRFMADAWRGGLRGKIGVMAALFAAFMFVRMFFGDVNIQSFFINIWRLDNERTARDGWQKKLDELNNHIALLESHSPDYVSELSQKYLNLGDPKLRILK